jgi:CheY-like chemotaxis protein/HPt (histidine-containing phosphotransfer) domain-containing protein
VETGPLLPESRPSPLQCRDGRRPRIILAEDSTAARILTAVLLRRMGCEVDAVEDGEEALGHVMARAYDVIILDIEMPVMDGVAAARRIRGLGGAKAATPIVAFSAFLADNDSDVGPDLFDGRLAKPAGRQALRAVLNRVLTSAGGATATVAELCPSTAPAGHLAGIRSQLPGDAWDELMCAAMQEFQQDLNEAVRAFSLGEYDQLRYRCHIIKGAARAFAATELAEIAGEIEKKVISQSPLGLASELNRLKACAERTFGSWSCCESQSLKAAR